MTSLCYDSADFNHVFVVDDVISDVYSTNVI